MSDRTETIIGTLSDAFGELMTSDPDAFRTKYRKMAADPFAFYRGSACLFHHDVTRDDAWDDSAWVDERTSRIWIHGDLHAENFGTYMDSDGRLVFDVNDFDEAYVGHFTWDLMRFAASIGLLGWQKALPEDAVRDLIATYLRAYLDQVDHYAAHDDDEYALRLDNTEGVVHALLATARETARVDLLDGMTEVRDGRRRFLDDDSTRRLDDEERATVETAFAAYVDTIPADKRMGRDVFYEVRDVVGKRGIGIGSAGLPKYSVLVEGFNQALDNDVVLSMKQANVPAVSRFLDDDAVESYFAHEGERTVVSQRALQAHTDPLLGWTTIDGVGYMVSEVSPYEHDLEWDDVVDPEVMAQVVEVLGRATAKVHCTADEDSEQDLVTFQVEAAVVAALEGRRDEFVSWTVDFGIGYSATVRDDHALFVEAFREGRIGGVDPV